MKLKPRTTRLSKHQLIRQTTLRKYDHRCHHAVEGEQRTGAGSGRRRRARRPERVDPHAAAGLLPPDVGRLRAVAREGGGDLCLGRGA